MTRCWPLAGLLALSACYETVPVALYNDDQTQVDERLSALEATSLTSVLERLDALEAENAALRGRVTELEGGEAGELAPIVDRLDALEADHVGEADIVGFAPTQVTDALDARVAALEGRPAGACPECVTYADLEGYGILADTVDIDLRIKAIEDGYATQAWVRSGYAEIAQHDALAARLAAVEASYVPNDAIVDMATQSWVQTQGYATEGWVTAAYPEQAEHDALADQVAALADGALTPDDIADMATRTWVTAAYPEQAEHDALAAQVAALADGALTPDDIADMATRTWVAAQGYATTSYADAGDDADRAWVLAQGYATSAEVASLGERLDDLGVDVDTLDAWLTGLDADLSAHDRRLDGLDADADSIWSALTEQQLALGKTLGVISEDLTVHVRPGATAGDASWTYGTIGAALRALDAWWISPSARVTIQVDDGVYDEGELRISHANGDRILIVGDPGDPDRVELRFQGTGLHLTDASALGGIDGVHLVGGTEGHAFEVSNNASLEIGGAVKTTGFANAVFAHDGGFVGISFGEPLLFADHPSYAGVNAENGAVVRAKGAAGADRPGGLRVDGGVYGIRAMMASSIDASYAYVTNASYEGIRGSVGSAIIANGSWVEGATDALGQAGLQGVVSGEVSVVVFDSGRVRGTGDVGLLAGDGGALLAQGAWSWDNASDDLRADSAAYVMFHAGGTPLDDVLIDATRPGDHALAFTQPDIYADARGYVSATSVSWTEPEGNTAEVDYLGAINLRGSTPNAACTPAKVPGEAGQPNAQPGHIVY